MKLTIAQTEEMYRVQYGPGSWVARSYSRSTLLKYRREFVAALKGKKGQAAARLRGCIAGLEETLEAGKADAKYERRVGYRQEGGDDGYQYVVRVDGIAKWSGLTRTEAEHYKRLEVRRLKEES